MRNRMRLGGTFEGTKSSAAMCLLLLGSACTVFEPPLLQPVDGGKDDVKTDASSEEPEPDAAAEKDAAPDNQDSGPTDSGPEDAGSDASDAQTDTGPEAGGSCALTGIDLMDMCNGQIVINEIDGSGDDFIEIYNRGETAVNISNYVLADDSGGNPDVAEGVVIPAGTVLDPHRFLYVWANIAPDPSYTGPDKFYDDCIPGAPSPCMHIDWGISAGGERVYMLNAALEVICAVTYNGVFGGEALGRITDGSDALCATIPTPGELNEPSTLR